MEDGCHSAYPHLDIGISGTQGVDEGEVVGDELVSVIGPSTWVSVVKAEVYDGLVGGKGHRVAIGLLLSVGAVTMVEERST
jgi:hypothetical protein